MDKKLIFFLRKLLRSWKAIVTIEICKPIALLHCSFYLFHNLKSNINTLNLYCIALSNVCHFLLVPSSCSNSFFRQVSNSGKLYCVNKKSVASLNNAYNLYKKCSQEKIKIDYFLLTAPRVASCEHKKAKCKIAFLILIFPFFQNYRVKEDSNGINSTFKKLNFEWLNISKKSRHSFQNRFVKESNRAKSLSDSFIYFNSLHSKKMLLFLVSSENHSKESKMNHSDIIHRLNVRNVSRELDKNLSDMRYAVKRFVRKLKTLASFGKNVNFFDQKNAGSFIGDDLHSRTRLPNHSSFFEGKLNNRDPLIYEKIKESAKKFRSLNFYNKSENDDAFCPNKEQFNNFKKFSKAVKRYFLSSHKNSLNSEKNAVLMSQLIYLNTVNKLIPEDLECTVHVVQVSTSILVFGGPTNRLEGSSQPNQQIEISSQPSTDQEPPAPSTSRPDRCLDRNSGVSEFQTSTNSDSSSKLVVFKQQKPPSSPLSEIKDQSSPVGKKKKRKQTKYVRVPSPKRNGVFSKCSNLVSVPSQTSSFIDPVRQTILSSLGRNQIVSKESTNRDVVKMSDSSQQTSSPEKPDTPSGIPSSEENASVLHVITAFKKEDQTKVDQESETFNSSKESSSFVSFNLTSSLPKFHHAFGRQNYQSKTLSSDDRSNCLTSLVPEKNGDNEFISSPTLVISKGVQTSLKEDCPRIIIKSNDSRTPTYVNNKADSGCSNKNKNFTSNVIVTDVKDSKPKEINGRAGVIFSCKVPVPSESTEVARPVKSVSPDGKVRIKTESNSTTTTNLVNSATLTTSDGPNNKKKVKETVIRSNMNALLAAAFHSTIRTNALSSSAISTIVKSTDQKNESLIQNSAKVLMTSPNFKIKRNCTQPQGITRLIRPGVNTVTSNNNILTPIVTVGTLPLRAVHVLNTNISSPAISTTKNERYEDSAYSPNSVQPAVCSTTLEQLREFESVLEQVANTSQMKERDEPLDSTDTTVLNNFEQSETAKLSPLSHSASLTTGSDLGSRNTVTVIEKSSTLTINNCGPMVHKAACPTPVVVVQNSSKSTVSNSVSICNQSNIQSKINLKLNKPKSKSIGKTNPSPSTLKVSTIPKPQQKPQEDEQTTQRIYAILDKYAEQLRNSPELKNKPAPRRRSNPPTNPSQSSKRKKSSQSKSKTSLTSSCSSNYDLSSESEDLRTIGSEDSSSGLNSSQTDCPSPTLDSVASPSDIGSVCVCTNNAVDLCSSVSKPTSFTKARVNASTSVSSPSTVSVQVPEVATAKVQSTFSHNKLVLTDSNGPKRTVILHDNLQPTLLNLDGSKVIPGKQVVVGGHSTVPLTFSLPVGNGNLKQVIFPVPSDARQVVVAKVPKMYRVHQVTMPSGTPLLTTATSGAVVLRQINQMLSKSQTVKSVKLPIVSSVVTNPQDNIITGQARVMAPLRVQALEPIKQGDISSVELDTQILSTLPSTVKSSDNVISIGEVKKTDQETNFSSHTVSILKADVLDSLTMEVQETSSSLGTSLKRPFPAKPDCTDQIEIECKTVKYDKYHVDLKKNRLKPKKNEIHIPLSSPTSEEDR